MILYSLRCSSYFLAVEVFEAMLNACCVCSKHVWTVLWFSCGFLINEMRPVGCALLRHLAMYLDREALMGFFPSVPFFLSFAKSKKVPKVKSVADPGFRRGECQPSGGGSNIRFCQIFPKTA